MVRVKSEEHILDDGRIDLEAWLQHLGTKSVYQNVDVVVRNACVLSELTGSGNTNASGHSCLEQGLAIAEILAELDLDATALAAAIIYESYQYADITLDDIAEQLGPEVAKLVEGVERMDAIHYMSHHATAYSGGRIDNIRKMLIAMVDDVRVVLIKLAERLCILRSITHRSDSVTRPIAIETMEIYAPLANRLGVGHIKWEMEDLAFRYLSPSEYKEIAKGLNSKRIERDKFIQAIVTRLQDELAKAGIKHADVYGRSKHIHSIHRKMQRKNVDLTQIYDAQAVRILVDSTEECYQALSIIHDLWQNIPEEFDDYITNPKDNGYRSLHTAVKTTDQRVFEVQIRTFDMHAQAEMGVAAHWRYKEGISYQQASHERKIDWLREVLDWQRECVEQNTEVPQNQQQFLEDRIYVFTPNGDVIDLPQNATPLDFAYSIHTEVGHRCRGAKINGQIVQLSQKLHTGDQVEILTAKQGQPSRDWLSAKSGYLTTPRARAKVLHWFKQQDYEKNVELGKEILDREIRKTSLSNIDYQKLAQQLNYKRGKDIFAALGAGDINVGQIINKLTPQVLPDKTKTSTSTPIEERHASGVYIEGVSNLENHLAKCCKPLPGDKVVGYITLGRGISIHRHDCGNILYALENRSERLVDVDWGSHENAHYTADIIIQAYERHQLVHDITALLSHEKAHLLALTTQRTRDNNMIIVNLTVETSSIDSLFNLINKLKQIDEVIEAKRINA